MNRIIITGATSMIGTALTEIAVREGAEVYAIIRQNTNRRDRIIKSPQVHIIYGSLDDLESVEGLPDNCDVFYHFAWAGTNKADRDNPLVQNDNVQYTLDAVKLAAKSGCRRFIGAGSQAEYGPTSDVIDENTKFAPTLSYGVAKYSAGILSRKLCQKLGMEHVWGRVFSVYGPHDNEGTMLKQAIKLWDNGESAHFSSGAQFWNYLYESDAGEMFYRLGYEHIPSGTYFIASNESRKLKEYIKILMSSYGENAEATFDNDSASVLPGLNVDTKYTQNYMKYKPKVSFEEGVEKMLDAISNRKQDSRNNKK